MTTVLVCGSRGYPKADLADWLDRKWPDPEPTERTLIVVHGNCRGPDRDATEWLVAAGHVIGVSVYDADWRKYGKAAGPIRNREMLDQEKPDSVLAFWDGNSLGTLDMIREATKRGIPVEVYGPRGEG